MADNPLYILPFDHRSSFIKGILGVKDREPTEEEINKARELKLIIFDAFTKAVEEGIPKENAGILTDEWLGIDVLKKAKEEGFIFCIPVEKSGQEEFQFDKEDWKKHIEEWNPNYVKALVRYNPEADKELNQRQRDRLSELSDFLKNKENKFILELLVPPTEEEKVIENYDNELRPELMVKAVEEFHKSNIYPEIWKIEGLDKTEDMQKVADKITENDPDAKIIILGRGESKDHAETWLKAGAKVNTSIGFAVGRTIFLKPLEEYNKESISKEEAIDKIKENYKFFVDVWTRSS